MIVPPGPDRAAGNPRAHLGPDTDGAGAADGDTCVVMYARAVDEAALELRSLRQDEWSSFGLGALAIGLALVATQVRPTFAIPLFLGGLAVAAGGVRAAWRHWDLLDRLTGERDAYAIPEVRARAVRAASLERRTGYAELIRASGLDDGRRELATRERAVREELRALVAELLDEELELDPARAVLCARLASDLEQGPLPNAGRPPEELRARVRRIRDGFSPRSRDAASGRREKG